MSPKLKLFPFYIESLKYGEIDMVYGGLTREGREAAARRQLSANGLCKPGLKVYKPPHIEGILRYGCENR
ncbi:hypothetical protein M2310_003959 [Rhizobium leguminosarum]|uniref:Uncharacterized protein n=1 Tax=Rhizobium esperanzae TaxID=1967781 RepID=A0A7W6XYD3_9HYPH|nr:hypothetical protein [Rhizobium esperanzae]MDH6203278.1 hypothetical protein [Rhizobium leguminosarum]